ncbi:transcriptional regulator [Rhizobium sp. SL86]|nr:transcriptional regulator [Rhizobium sp. SL86]
MNSMQCRMARAALQLGVLDLAKLAKVSTNTIVRFERGEPLRAATKESIATVFRSAGIEFIDEIDGKGVGVRLTNSSRPHGRDGTE